MRPVEAGVSWEQLRELVSEAAAALEQAEGRARLTKHSLMLTFHGRLSGCSVPVLLGRYIQRPPGVFGPVKELGARYVFEPRGRMGSSWLWFEPSTAVAPDGLFVNVGANFDSELISSAEVIDEMTAYFREVLDSPETPVEVTYD